MIYHLIKKGGGAIHHWWHLCLSSYSEHGQDAWSYGRHFATILLHAEIMEKDQQDLGLSWHGWAAVQHWTAHLWASYYLSDRMFSLCKSLLVRIYVTCSWMHSSWMRGAESKSTSGKTQSTYQGRWISPALSKQEKWMRDHRKPDQEPRLEPCVK